MADLITSERLQPSLLDRLTDDFPHIKQESRDKRVMNMRQLRAAVLRDLAYLLNTPCKPLFEDLHQFPRVQRSVLNFGITDFTGMTTSGISPAQMERIVQRAITDFEPRIVADSLKINAVATKESWGNAADQKFEFEISGDYCPLPMPEALFLRTQVDLETGQCDVREKA